MDTITASCPKCGTQYQLTPEQLNVAQGQVRCGACMTVFQAVEPAAAAKPAAEPAPRGPERSSFVNDEDDILLSDTGVRKSFDKSENFATGEFSADFADLEAEQGFGFGHEDKKEDDDDVVDADESWAEALLDDETGEHEAVADAGSRAAGEQPRQALGSSSTDLDDIDDDLSGLDDTPLLLKTDEHDLGLDHDDKEGLLGRINPEPLEFKISRDYTILKTLAYGTLSLVLLAALGAQYLLFQFNELSRNPEWRPTYEKLCAQLDCQLPAKYNLADIKARHLTVKSHPSYRNALVVDLIVTNHAEIEQPFPELTLFFTDNNQQIVAARRFKPTEYLRGELAHRDLMPSRQPIHLALAIKDPGARASGYSIDLSY